MWLAFSFLRIVQKTPFPGTVRLAVLQTRGEIQKLVFKGADEEDKQGEAEASHEEGGVPCRWRIDPESDQCVEGRGRVTLDLPRNVEAVACIVQSLSLVRLLVTPWTAARPSSLSITSFQSLLRLLSVESLMPSNDLILCRSRCFCWKSPAFLMISASSGFSKSSLDIWKFMVHVLLKPGLENFEHYFTSV